LGAAPVSVAHPVWSQVSIVSSSPGLLVSDRPFKLAVLNSHPIQYFAPLYRALARHPDIELTVYYCSRQNMTRGIDDPGFGREVVWDIPLLEGYDYEFLENVGGDRGVDGFLKLVNPGILSRLWHESYDALIVHGHAHLTALLAVAGAKLRRTALLMRGESNLTLRSGPLRHFIRTPLLRALYRFCDAFLYIGSLNRAYYESYGVRPDRLFFAPYVVDNERFHMEASTLEERASLLRASLGIGPASTAVLYMSKLIQRKRPFDLLEAHRRLQSSASPPELLVVGDGPELDRVRHTVAQQHIPRVHFFGFRNQSELPLFYAAADVFVLPSENEPWGLVVNEAMAAGTPVIATRGVGAAADLIRHGETGFVYETGDIQALERHIETLVLQADLRSRMAQNCRRLMEGWSYEQCIEGILHAIAFATGRDASLAKRFGTSGSTLGTEH
jgi:glycosyltransferase involved in cell wall biosynthesis